MFVKPCQKYCCLYTHETHRKIKKIKKYSCLLINRDSMIPTKIKKVITFIKPYRYKFKNIPDKS